MVREEHEACWREWWRHALQCATIIIDRSLGIHFCAGILYLNLSNSSVPSRDIVKIKSQIGCEAESP